MHTIMLVDDEYMVLEGLKVIIHRVLPECKIIACAYDGDEGFRLGMESKPEIVITDIRMLKNNGLSMIEKLQKAGLDASYIIISGYQEFQYAKQGMQLGIRYYLDKPIEESELQDCIHSIITDIEQGAKSAAADTIVEEAGQKDPIANIRRYLIDNFAASITLKELSDKFYINPYYLSRLFKERTGENYSDYLAHLRIKRAKELLVKTDMKVYEICEAVGYTDVPHFAKVFEKIVQCTPTEYRKRFAVT